jgi:hypothetical protein
MLAVQGHQPSQEEWQTEISLGLSGRRLTRNQDTSRGDKDEGAGVITLNPSFTLSMSTKKSDGCLNTKGCTVDKTCLVTTDIRESASITWPDIPAGLPKKEWTWLYVLQMVSGEILS